MSDQQKTTALPNPAIRCTMVPPCGKCWYCAATEAMDAGVDVLAWMFAKVKERPKK